MNDRKLSLQVFPLFYLMLTCASLLSQPAYNAWLTNHREEYKQGFLRDERAPLAQEDLSGLAFFPADSTWKLTCQCALTDNASPFELPTYSGVTRTYIHYATATCERNKQTFEVRLYKNMTQPANPLYSSHLFLPFKDETNDETTYGGGRYINLSSKEIVNQKIIIDFNTCYNPWCAYSSGYNCPIPPRENHFPFEIRAGEMKYTGTYKNRKG
jgi:uncharacterized protein (DUF1684 family)